MKFEREEYRFVSDLKYEDISIETGEFRIRLLEPFTYISRNNGLIMVPKGFECDLASIPQFAQTFLSKVGPQNGAAVIHDAMYFFKMFDRKTCDNIFAQSLVDAGIDEVTAMIMYLAVRAGGFDSYHRDRSKT